jgi:DNA-binding winged helix-turn-helix (wHTH) protein/tetratricopeptide (TPR) repeat protein
MIYIFGDYALDTHLYELRHSGTPCPLGPQVFNVLAYLIANHERVVTKDELIEHLWPAQCVSDATVHQHVTAARKAIGDSGLQQRIVKTLRSRGYRFIAPVEVHDEALSRDGPVAPEEAPHVAQQVLQPVAAVLPTLHKALMAERKLVTVLGGTLANAVTLVERLGLEALPRLRQAEPLAEALGDQRRLAQLAGYLSVCLRRQGHIDEALASAQRALAIATALGDVDLQVATNSFLGELYLWVLNDYRQAVEPFRRNVEILHGALLRERFGTTNVQSVVCRAQVARCLAELGGFAEGRAYAEDALQLAETVDHPYSLIWVCNGVGHLFLRQGALSQAIHVLERARALREAANFPHAFRLCHATLGAAYILSGRVTESLPLLEQVLEVEQSLPASIRRSASLFPVWLGEGYMLAGRLEEAMQLGEQALEVTRTQMQKGYQAYALRLLGDIAARRTPPVVEEAERQYREALVLAEALGMRPLQAHCHSGLGMLYAKLDQREQARAALATAVDLYRAMDMTFWLPETMAALAQVEER